MDSRKINDFISITKLNLFLRKFCTTQWVENSVAINRAFDIMEYVKLYIKHTTTKLPVNLGKSITLLSKLVFFSTITEFLESFLKCTNLTTPSFHFCIWYGNNYKKFTGRFLLIETATFSLYRLLRIHFDHKKYHKPIKDIIVGFKTNK